MNRNPRACSIFEALFALALGLLILALAGRGGGAATSAPRVGEEPAEGGSSSYAGNFVGEVPGTDAFLAVVVDKENRVLAYLCDGRAGGEGGEPFEWSVSEWFSGDVSEEGVIDLVSDGGARLVANVVSGDEGAQGTVTLPDGEEHAFSLEPAEEPAGLYRAEETVDGEELVGGWILLANGEERGAVKNRSSGFIQSDVDLARPSRPVDGFIETGIDI